MAASHKSAMAATGLTITAQHRNETRKPRSNRFMSLKGEKSSMVALCVEEDSNYNMKEGSPHLGAKAMT